MKVKSISSVCLSLTLLGLVGCASNDRLGSSKPTPAAKEAKYSSVDKTSDAVAKSDGSYYTVLKFKKGTQDLTEESKRDLREFVATAKKNGKIDNIKILSWADREYPKKGAALTDKEISIADERAKSIEEYLKDDLNTSADYSSYNMAKRPNKVSEFFRADDYKTKRMFEKTGAAPTTKKNDLNAFLNNKASKSVIMVDYE
jgi:hypothetical protein